MGIVETADCPMRYVSAPTYDAAMWRFEEIGDQRRPSWWTTVLLGVLVFFGTMLSAVFSPASYAMDTSNASGPMLLTMGATVVALVAPLTLFWRHRMPFLLTGAGALLALVLPIGNTLAFVALASLIARRRGPAVLWMLGLVVVTSSWVVIMDALAQPAGASVFKYSFAPVGTGPDEMIPSHPAGVMAVLVIGLALTLGAGWLTRSRRETTLAREATSEQRAASDRLGDEAARRQERERIAREVHDVIGHRLSLLNLHAGAVEAHAMADPRLSESARLARTTAAAAMDDLRSLVSVLRDPAGAETADLPLTKLADVVHASFGAGQRLSSSIFVQDAERADPTLSRAVYRIVQELLTNAARHAPGEQLFLSVEGGPDHGVVIDARNRYVGGLDSRTPGGSRGLTGITERAELLGGRMLHGLDQDGRTFRVRVELPWRARTSS